MYVQANGIVQCQLAWRPTCTAGVKRSLDVRAHLRRLWRHLEKKYVLQLVPVTR